MRCCERRCFFDWLRQHDCREWTRVTPFTRRPLGYNLNAYAIELPLASGDSFGNANLLVNGDAGMLDTTWWQVSFHLTHC
jgi:hypothetical protein